MDIRSSQRGQVLLLVVLTMVVALTVGLSIASRIVTELKISKQNEESQRAFQAAEAGIQQSLKAEGNVSVPEIGNNASFTSNFASTGVATIIGVNSGIEVDQDTGADVWLSKYSATQPDLYSAPMGGGSEVSVEVYWGTKGTVSQTDCSTSATGATVAPGLEIVILENEAAPKIKKYVFDCGRIPGASAADNNGGAGYIISGESYAFKGSVPIKFTNGLVMKIIPIFNSTPIRLDAGSVAFPKQGSEVISTGTSGETTRRIKYFTSLPQLPIEVFPYSILSQ